MSVRIRLLCLAAPVGVVLCAALPAAGQPADPAPAAPTASPAASASAAPPAPSAPSAAPAPSTPASAPGAPAAPTASAPATPATPAAPAKPAAGPKGAAAPGAPEHTAGIEVAVGDAYRLNDSVTGLPFDARHALGLHLGGFWAPSRSLSLGMTYNRLGLGSEYITEREASSTGTTTRRLDALMLDLRLFPLRGKSARLFVGLLGSFGVESVERQGTIVDRANVAPTISTFRCKASGGAGFGLGASLGADVDLGDYAAFIVRGSVMSHRLPSEALFDKRDFCAWGGGSTDIVEAQVGFQLRFDIASVAAAPR